LIWFLIILIPSGISIARYFSIKPGNAKNEEVVIVQPDIDPYTEKFKIPFEIQLSKVISIAEQAATSDTKWIITPETTVDDPADLHSLNADRYVIRIRQLAQEYPSSSVVTGMVTFMKYPPSDKAPSASAVLKDSSGSYFDHFNSALKIDSGKQIEVYHKSKLVPGIEMQFAWNPLRLLAGLLPDLGGTNWGYGIRNNSKCFINNVTMTKIAPIICYESIYGEYIANYVNDGANALFIITNDGWWKNTIGYKQHLWFASLRAIETRRMVARAANTGISCIVDIRGKRIKETGWWEEAVLKGEIIPETRITPYVKYGDYLLRLGAISAIIILSAVFIGVPVRNKLRSIK
jgi:apolipoprotein N-acyltransferase